MRTLLALVVAAGCTNTAARPDERAEPAPAPVLTPEAETPPPPPPRIVKVADPIDVTLGAGFELRQPIVDGRLALIPIVATDPTPAVRYVTLQAGLASGVVVVSEAIDEESPIDGLRVRNNGTLPLAILEGEVVIDGNQDRITAEAKVIPPHGTDRIEVRCIEKGRSEGESPRFHASHAIAELALRRTVSHLDQDGVWARIAAINGPLGLQTETETYRHAARRLATAPAIRDRAAHLAARLAALPERKQLVGVAVAIDNEVVAVEQLATPALYRTLEPMLLASYLPDTEGTSRAGERAVRPSDVRALLVSGRAHATPAGTTTFRTIAPL
jgi:hypothetical protein